MITPVASSASRVFPLPDPGLKLWWLAWSCRWHGAAQAWRGTGMDGPGRDRRSSRPVALRAGPVRPPGPVASDGITGRARRRGGYPAVTGCRSSLVAIWMLRGLACSRTGMVRVRTPAL